MFEPLAWQEAPYQDDHSPLILLTGGFAGGKTDLGCAKVHRFCKQHTDARAFLIRKTTSALTNGLALTFDRFHIQNDPSVEVVQRKSEKVFRYANGSRVYYGRVDWLRQWYEQLRQHNAPIIIFADETHELTVQDWAWLLGLQGIRQKIVSLVEPYAKFLSLPQATVYPSTAADNPYLDAAHRRLLKNFEASFQP